MDQPRNESGQYVSLEKFVTTLMDERMRAHAVEHLLIDKALEKANDLVDARLANLNDLRAEVVQDRAAYVTRETFDLQMKPLQEFKDKALGFGTLVALISATVGSVLTVLVLRVFS